MSERLRAERARRALGAVPEYRSTSEEGMTDLLTDLLHLATDERVDTDRLIERARCHHAAERNEDAGLGMRCGDRDRRRCEPIASRPAPESRRSSAAGDATRVCIVEVAGQVDGLHMFIGPEFSGEI